MRHRQTRERGNVILIMLVWSILLAGLGYAFLTTVTVENRVQRARIERTRAIYIAEAGTTEAVVNVIPHMADGSVQYLGTETSPLEFGGGGYWVTISSLPAGLYLVETHAQCSETSVIVESRWGREAHPYGDYAIYAGNRSGSTADDLVLGGTWSERDIVNGKVYVTGDLRVTGNAEVHGDADTTGSITGTITDGAANSGADPIPPPDLAAMKYDEIADFKVDAAAGFDASGRLPVGDPRHIFVKEFRSDLATTAGFTFDNVNYFLGDPWEGSGLASISVPSAGNDKIYFVDGNLWIEPNGATSSLVGSPLEGTHITVVVKGNIYLADTFQYDDPAKDAVLFIALTDGESYRDVNDNNQYDAGEPILHDDGDGVYEGPAEGSGNILFGDPNGGALGHVHAFLYADNDFKDHVLDGTSGSPLPFQVTGHMSAGEQVQIRRDFGTQHAQMIVNYDERAATEGMANLVPGFPSRIGGAHPGLLTWHLRGAP